MSGFHGAFATGVACQQGTLTLPDTWFRPPLWDCLCSNSIIETRFVELAMSFYSTFYLEYPLVLSRFCHIYTCINKDHIHVRISFNEVFNKLIFSNILQEIALNMNSVHILKKYISAYRLLFYFYY